MNRRIAFFDFDGTLTTKDTMLELVKFSKGVTAFYTGMIQLSPWLLAMKMKLYSRQKAKEKLLTHFFGNMDQHGFNSVCHAFCSQALSSLIRPAALHTIRKYQEEDTEVVIVSASASNWIQPWCMQYNLKLIATELEVLNGKITGKLSTPNCHGEEKVRRIKNLYKLEEYQAVHAYGDTKGDKPMLGLATSAYYKPFRD